MQLLGDNDTECLLMTCTACILKAMQSGGENLTFCLRRYLACTGTLDTQRSSKAFRIGTLLLARLFGPGMTSPV